MPINTNSDIQEKIIRAREKYPSLWRQFIQDWRVNESADHAWLMYSANYLFRTSGVHWALDPFSLSTRIKGVAQPDFATDLAPLELVALTHAHNDHLDLSFIRSVAHLPMQWIIPDHMLDLVLKNTPLNRDQIIVPVNGTPIIFKTLKITPFDSLHFHFHGGIAETGYLVEFNGKKWLFPGDIRNFDHEKLPSFGKLDGIFAHLWLGKGKALETNPPLLDDFYAFYNALSPARLVITHLNEFGRVENELWNEQHYAKIAAKLNLLNPKIKIEMALMGMSVDL